MTRGPREKIKDEQAVDYTMGILLLRSCVSLGKTLHASEPLFLPL